MKISIAIVALTWSVVLLSQQSIISMSKRFGDGLPRLPHSCLLIGLPPFFLELTGAQEVVRLQPEQEQPETRDATAVYPTLSRDGMVIAYARVVLSQYPRVVTVSTYSRKTDKHMDYASGTFSGSIAISPDASKLEYGGHTSEGRFPADNHLHIVDLRSGEQSLGPEIVVSGWRVFASWSPDLERLAFSDSGEIRVWDAKSGKVWKVADGDLPVWSPSGEWIAYLPGAWEPDLKRIVFNPGHWGPQCWLVHPDGTERKKLIDWTQSKRSPRFFSGAPVWSPDSRTILLNEMDNLEKMTVTVHAVDVSTAKVRTLFRHSYHVLAWARED
jgi:Tol biopolymer transport system component